MKNGDIVKFKRVLSGEKAQIRMVIIGEPAGGRVMVGDLAETGDKRSLYIDELEVCD